MSLDLDEFLRHELYLNRLASGGINGYVLPSLENTYKAIRRILQEAEVISNNTELKKITREIEKAIIENGGWPEMTAESLEPLSTYEYNWQAAFVGSAYAFDATIAADRTIISYVTNAIMSLESGSGKVQAGVWEQFYRANLDSRTRTINSIVNQGYSRGETINQISKSIRDSISGVLKRESEALARTGYQHYAASANDLMVQKNSDILSDYFYVVTFDSRTSNICQSISTKNAIGNRFKVGDPKAPRPPLHFNCRTRRIALEKNAIPTGTRAAIGAKESGEEAFDKRKERLRTKSQVTYRGKKDLNIFTPEQVKAGTSLDSWLRQQPDYYIRDTLKGEKRFKLFKDGGLTLKNFSDVNGNPLTLDEIIERHPIISKRVL